MERARDDQREDRDSRDDREPSEEPRQADLLSIGLLVFFVSLIGVVGALLLMPILL